MDKKKIIIIGSIVAVLLSIAVIIYVTTKTPNNEEYTIDGIDLPKNKEILNDTTVDNLKITDISLLTRNGVSTFKATVSNETAEDIIINKLYVVFYEGEKENKIPAIANATLSPGEKTYINITSESNLSNTSKIEYILE